MRIIIINGSNRKNGATATIMNEIYSSLKQYKDVEINIVHVADMNLKYCIGCCTCYKTGKCIYKDDVEMLSAEIEEADGIILGTPTYASNVSGQMKTVIDRGHFVIEQLLRGKYAMSVVTYENYGGKTVGRILNNLLSCSGAQISGTIICKTDFGDNPSDNPIFVKNVQRKAERLYKDICREKRYIWQSLRHFIVFHIGIRPFVEKKGEQYKGVMERWKSKNILQKKSP